MSADLLNELELSSLKKFIRSRSYGCELDTLIPSYRVLSGEKAYTVPSLKEEFPLDQDFEFKYF